MSGFLAGKVFVCGGNNGVDFNGIYRVHNQCHFARPSSPVSWIPAPPMLGNTTNAAYTVHDDNLYVFGGYQKPACGMRPGVQIFSSDTNSWSWSTKHDPPFEVGAYQCAVTAGDLIFVIGGWYPWNLYPSSPTCKEKLSSSELSDINKEFKYYQDRVQIYDTKKETLIGKQIWYQGPPLLTRRRKHGCSLIKMSGTYGIMVVGGTNSQDGTLNSVEYLDLGNNLSKISVNNLKWTNLRSMTYPRMGNPVLLDGKDHVYVIGGQTDTDNIERFDKKQQQWESLGYGTNTKRFDFSFVKLPKTSINC